MRSRLVRPLRAGLDRFFRHPAVDAAIMALILASVALLLVEFYLGKEGEDFHWLYLVSDLITAVFIVELSLRWIAAPSTRAHWREFWLDWLAVIPFFRPVRILRGLRFLRAVRLLRLFRFGLLAHRFAGTFDAKRFDDALHDSLAHSQGRYAEFVWLAHDLYRMLSNLMEDGRVHREARALICQAIAYFTLPYDVLWDDLPGGEGYLDDVCLALWVVQRLADELPQHVLQEAWEGEGHLSDLVGETLPAIERILEEEQMEKIRRYIGLPDAGRTALPPISGSGLHKPTAPLNPSKHNRPA